MNYPWRKLRPLTYQEWKTIFSQAGAPSEIQSEEAYNASGKYSTAVALIIANDSKYWTEFNRNVKSNNNPGNIRVPSYANENNPSGYVKFDTVADGVAAIAARISGNQNYKPTETVEDLLWMWIGGPSRYYDAKPAIRDSYIRLEKWGIKPIIKMEKTNMPALTLPSKAEFLVDIAPASLPNVPEFELVQSIPWWITGHETANFNIGAGALMHRNFLHSGGGQYNVSYHFTVDDKYIIQLMEVWRGGYHAGDGCDEYPDGYGHDDIGCFASVAIELCVNPDSNWEQAKRNFAELLAMLATHDPRIVGMERAKGKFSLNRVTMHRTWSGKICPLIQIREGSWDNQMDLANDIYVALTSSVPGPAQVMPFPAWDGSDKFFNRAPWFAIKRKVHAAKRTFPYAWADSENAPHTGDPIEEGQDLNVRWVVKSADGPWYYVDKFGNRWRMSSFVERLIPSRARIYFSDND